MDKSSINIFGSNSDTTAIMPTIQTEVSNEQSELISDENQVYDNIMHDTVVRISLPKEATIAEKNFIFDFSDMESISVFQKEALKSLVSTEGNVSLYLYKKNNITKFGEGEQFTLERMVPLLRHYVFCDDIKIYKDYAEGKPLEEIEARDITKLRLNL